MPAPSILIEACVESVDEAIAAARGGADRIELCANLDQRGTTPSIDLIRACASATSIPIVAMIRPHDRGFCYTSDEVDVMTRAIRAAIDAGALGIVTGALDAARAIDRDPMRRLIDAAGGLPVTCHRAFDDARDLDEAVDTLMQLGVARVLTSGGAPTVAEGAAVIADLVARAGTDLSVIAGGGVRPHNVAAIVTLTNVREIHARTANADDVTEMRRALLAPRSR